MLSPVSSSRTPTPPPAYTPRSLKATLLQNVTAPSQDVDERMANCESMYADALRAMGRWIAGCWVSLLKKTGIRR
jgi:hypothetical protein